MNRGGAKVREVGGREETKENGGEGGLKQERWVEGMGTRAGVDGWKGELKQEK